MRVLAAVTILMCCVFNSFGMEPEMVRPETLPQGFVLIVKDNSGMADKDNPIYLAGSINGWNPSDEEMTLSGRSDTRWQIIVDRDLHGVGLEFKFTLGGWDREELDENGESIPNRTLPLVDASALSNGERPVIEIEIPKFRVPVALSEQVRQQGIYRELEVTGTVQRVEVRGGAGGAEAMTRDLQVWLPEGYNDAKNADHRYPVLYMFDGQNLFSQMPGVPAEWGIDETLTDLIASGRVEPMIVVGIPHSGEHRIREFMPIGSYKGIEGDGAACMDWVMSEVMPKINRAFRVRTDRDSTAIGGASLGGAMALYGSTMYPDTFGKALIESLPMIDQEATIQHIGSAKRGPSMVVIGMGSSEVGTDPSDAEKNKQYVDWASKVTREMSDSFGMSRKECKLIIGKGDVHNESAWSNRFAESVQFLFPAN
ncbi:MAG: alpha/beta hydrolase-fold protein [Phycisphaerales bacterium]